ncbi:hypothetical protein BP5796_12771 [Coleophoma crateriformis]|uniref:Heterokaryon incompatibility domain-containing protein n=1 Tax=Coleophoma crateriformis TaxID=565419 RepID=A0A3D8Q688_9HELO|nr:hypothetical protein BP5796_12771 [Coleophoma crateriformis]
MSSYPYSLLPNKGDHIRLLRLLPNEDEAAPIQCELLDYSLQRLSSRSHLYEALSYVWGVPHDKLRIDVDNDPFLVTVNLHVALSHLRDPSLERILWVDAICINQNDNEERAQQVQLMVKIYSKAHRVIVWLGKETVNTTEALEDIQFAASDEFTELSKIKINKQAIFALLQRPWFERVWVLQEVAAARHIAIACGPTEIEGHAFCLGLKSLQLSYTDVPKLQTLPSITYLIEGASLRSRNTANSLEKSSLNIRTLVELIDMFRTRHASDVRDKVYALLGMASDDPVKAGLQPDYNILWEELFRNLVRLILGKHASVETGCDKDRPLIKSKGSVVGQVAWVRTDKKLNVNIGFTSQNIAWYPGKQMDWTLLASAEAIRDGDVICFLQGASQPTVIRLYRDYFEIIMISVTPLREREVSKQSELRECLTFFPRDFLLAWDWIQAPKELRDQGESNSSLFDKSTRTWNIALILGDLNEVEKEKYTLQEAIKGYNTIFEGEQTMLKLQHGLTPLCWAARNGFVRAVKLLLGEENIDLNLKDSQYSRTPLSWAAGNGHETVVKLLLETGQLGVDFRDHDGRTPLSWAAKNGYTAIVKLLLETGLVIADSKDRYSWTPLLYAAKNGYEAIIKMLLKTSQIKVDFKSRDGRTPLSWAAGNGHEAIVKLLLETGQVEVDFKDQVGRTPLTWAASNGYEAIVKLLLETGHVNADSKDPNGRTPLSWAARNGHEAIVKLLLETGEVEVDFKDQDGRTPLSWAARNGHVNADSKDRNGRTPLSWAAESGCQPIVKLLLETGQVNANSEDRDGLTPSFYAAQKNHQTIVALLVETR